MNDKRLDFYESLIRLSLILIFVSSLIMGSVALVSICWLLAQSGAPALDFATSVDAL